MCHAIADTCTCRTAVAMGVPIGPRGYVVLVCVWSFGGVGFEVYYVTELRREIDSVEATSIDVSQLPTHPPPQFKIQARELHRMPV
jgi:hypothetical protein